MKVKNNKRKSPEKYNLGAFVTKNQQSINNATNAIGALSPLAGGGALSGAMSGLSTGASIGSVVPGIGNIIGGAVGLVGGALFGGLRKQKQEAAKKAQLKAQDDIRGSLVADEYESNLDLVNENPYGVYAKGGDVIPAETINIEKGELQINPNTGKILRKFDGINPETGGKYEAHNKKGKDSKNNMVTAEEGTFIITKKEASKYEDAVNNNDKLHQNSIMSNIRNQKYKTLGRNPKKYATGGLVDPKLLPNINPMGAGLTGTLNMPKTLPTPAGLAQPAVSNLTSPQGVNYNGLLDNVVNYLPSAVNMVQGLKTPNYLEYRPTRMNVGLRQRTLENLPNEISVNPLINQLNSASYSADRDILNSTSNSSISRALRQNNNSLLRRNISGAYMDVAGINNQIRAQRAGIYSNLGYQDQQRSAQNAQMILGVDTQNRQMDLAKQQQFNYGTSQAQQMYQNNRTNVRKAQLDEQQLALLAQIFPSAAPLITNWRGGTR